mgnify:CR=1 FL=1
MTRQKSFSLALLLLLCVLCAFAVQLLSAQDSQCGVVDAVAFPIDPNTFQIVQGFGAPSPRHNGRYHTAEDWFGGVNTLGQPVYAIARGRVTYSAPNAWGRDGGVVIIEHAMPDGTTAYSMYGHMNERGDISFPARFTCVQVGDIVGTVGDIRPAPHVHIEIRTNNPDIPGVGYEWEDPRTLGYRQPSAFITDWQAWLDEASLWHTEFADAPLAPPLVLEDYSLMMLNGEFLRRVLPDGRILWRVTLEEPAVAVVGYEGAPLLISADGTIQRVDYEGNFGESWLLDAQFDSPPLEVGDAYIFHTPDNALVAIDRRWRAVLWRLDDVPPFVRAYSGGSGLALVTAEHELLLISPDGRLLDRSQLRGVPGIGAGSALLVLSRTGLWYAGETWRLAKDMLPMPSPSFAVAQFQDRAAVFDGTALILYDDAFNELWRTALPNVTGQAQLTLVDENRLLLTSTDGQIILLSAENGALCGSLRLWGDVDEALLWHDLGDDGVLRVLIGQRLVGLDWQEFNRC